MRRPSFLVMMGAILALAGLGQAAVTIGPYTFADNAFPDAASYVSGGPPTLSFPSSGDINQDLLLAAGPDATKYIYGTPVRFYLDFLDNRLVNGSGADLVLFELGTPDAAELAIRVDSGAGWTTPQTFLMTDTGFDVAGYNLDAVAVDLDVFGIAALEQIERIELYNTGTGSSTISSSICAVGARNSADVTVIPVPGALVLGGIGASLFGLLRRRRVL